MSVTTRRATAFPARLYAYSFFEEFILLYPVYAVLFADTGLSTPAISSLFVIWSVTGLLVEIPSGALADLCSRRLLLAIGPLLAGAGFWSWVAFPSYLAFAIGFVLWGCHGALQSGALEALVYEELDHQGRSASYAKIIGRSRAAGAIAATTAMGVAGPAFSIGGYQALGVASVAACVLASITALTFPEHRRSRRHRTDEVPTRFIDTVRTGVREVALNPRLRALVIFLVGVASIWGVLDEFVPLLAAERGIAVADIPLFVLVVYFGVAAGGILGGLAYRLRRHAVAALLALAALALAVGSFLNHPAGFALLAAAFCVFQMSQIAMDAHIQDTTSGTARSTVTSVAGFSTEVATIAVYGIYAAGSTMAGHNVLFVAGAAGYVVLAVLLSRRSPSA